MECLVYWGRVNTNDYIVKFYPLESCDYKIEKQFNYFLVTADKDVNFDYEVMGRRKGFETDRLELANDIKSNLVQPNERNPLPIR